MNNLIHIENLSKQYEDFALNIESFDVPSGCVVGLVGGNGAGKTTLIKSILGITPHAEGKVELLDKDLSTVDATELVQLKRDVGVVFDSCSYPDEFTSRQCATAMEALYPSWDNETFSQLVQRLELPLDRKVKVLSRGMGMKLTLACALAHTPQLLILDEATAGLDPMMRDEVVSLLREFIAQDEGRAILMSSHITDDLDKIADYIVCLDKGRVTFDISRDELEQAGTALCRAADLDTLANSDFAKPLRVIREVYAARVLVPDRFDFAKRFESIPVEPVNTEAYMQFMMKGELL